MRDSTAAATARLHAAEEERDLTRRLKQALKAPDGERSAEAAALLAANPEAAARHREAMDRTAARKLQDEANATEVEEDEAELQQKVVRLAELLRAARHPVVYTGAGVSTSANIPDYRGPRGIWTMHKKGAHNANSAARAEMMGMAFVEAQPTQTHMGLAALTANGLVKSIISQNVDGLHLRSGVPARSLCELHGNVFREVCSKCRKEYLRGLAARGRQCRRGSPTPPPNCAPPGGAQGSGRSC
jgi:NAD-dependent deacetylase sirtuin 7